MMSSIFNTKINDDLNLNGFYIDFGFMYKVKIKEWNSVLGITFDNGSEISAEKHL